jgi:hypothetical protein
VPIRAGWVPVKPPFVPRPAIFNECPVLPMVGLLSLMNFSLSVIVCTGAPHEVANVWFGSSSGLELIAAAVSFASAWRRKVDTSHVHVVHFAPDTVETRLSLRLNTGPASALATDMARLALRFVSASW